MKTVVDTNVIFAYLYEKDPYHEKASNFLENLEIIYLPSVVIFELSFLLMKYNGDLNIIYYILSSKNVEYVETILEDVLFAINKNPKTYDDFNDYIILHTALRLKANLLTFDKKLEKEFKNNLK